MTKKGSPRYDSIMGKLYTRIEGPKSRDLKPFKYKKGTDKQKGTKINLLRQEKWIFDGIMMDGWID